MRAVTGYAAGALLSLFVAGAWCCCRSCCYVVRYVHPTFDSDYVADGRYFTTPFILLLRIRLLRWYIRCGTFVAMLMICYVVDAFTLIAD